MNSTYASKLLANERSGDYHTYPEHIRNIPIPNANKEKQQEIVALVKQMIELRQNDDEADITEKQHCLDQIVYTLYGIEV